MKTITMLTVALAVAGFAAFAQDAEDPFADTVEMRHGLMLQMATDLGTVGPMAKGEVAYDATVASKAAANIAAVASVISMAQWPEGSQYGAAADSYALPAIWATPDDFLTKIADLNTAAAAFQVAAATDVDALKTGMGALGGACSACHKAYRQPEE
ncbi:MAG: cytochrome c [Rhodobacterales bacterium]|nr:MAG: cytochrome c [Rhodobacterales bacterium]